MKICIVGSPGSGKTTLAAMLYTRCLLLGLGSARLVLEEAPRYIGETGKLDCLLDQIKVWNNQLRDCNRIERGGFSPIILDGALWLSSVYVRYSTEEGLFKDYMKGSSYEEASSHIYDSEQYFNEYDLTIYTPYVDRMVKTGIHRIHNKDQAMIIDGYIQKGLERIGGQLMVAPEAFGDRPRFLDEIHERIKAWTSSKE